jgi:hypothetical protein
MMKTNRPIYFFIYLLLAQGILFLCTCPELGIFAGNNTFTVPCCEEIEECFDDRLEEDIDETLFSSLLFCIFRSEAACTTLRRENGLLTPLPADRSAGSYSGWMMPLRI